MALRSHLVPSTVTEFQRRKSCFSWRRSGGLAGFSVEFPPEQEEEVKHVSRINGVCRRRHGKTTLWHIDPWCLCAVWTNLTQPNGLWVERGSATFSGIQTANKCATGGRRLQHAQLSTWLAKKEKNTNAISVPWGRPADWELPHQRPSTTSTITTTTTNWAVHLLNYPVAEPSKPQPQRPHLTLLQRPPGRLRH